MKLSELNGIGESLSDLEWDVQGNYWWLEKQGGNGMIGEWSPDDMLGYAMSLESDLAQSRADNARLRKELEELRVEGARSDDCVWPVGGER